MTPFNIHGVRKFLRKNGCNAEVKHFTKMQCWGNIFELRTFDELDLVNLPMYWVPSWSNKEYPNSYRFDDISQLYAMSPDVLKNIINIGMPYNEKAAEEMLKGSQIQRKLYKKKYRYRITYDSHEIKKFYIPSELWDCQIQSPYRMTEYCFGFNDKELLIKLKLMNPDMKITKIVLYDEVGIKKPPK